jgi:hypothetical protein
VLVQATRLGNATASYALVSSHSAAPVPEISVERGEPVKAIRYARYRWWRLLAPLGYYLVRNSDNSAMRAWLFERDRHASRRWSEE